MSTASGNPWELDMGVVLDSSFLIDVLKGKEAAVLLGDRLDESRETVVLPTPALYEIEAGLKFTRSRSEAKAFERTATRFPLATFGEHEALKAAEIRAELLRLGQPKSHTEVMIAGIALAHGHRLVTNDDDFRKIAEAVGLEIETYA